MAQPAPAPALPIFAPVDPAHITAAEWTGYRTEVDNFFLYINGEITTLDPAAVVEPTPASFIANPAPATQRLLAAGATTAWLYRLQAQANQLIATAAAAQAQAALAQAQATAGQVAPPVIGARAGQVNVAQLVNIIANMQAQVNNLVAAQMAPVAPPAAPLLPRIKTSLPDKFTGDIKLTRHFLNQCDNYFTLNYMTHEQKVRFALQLVTGEAEYWQRTTLDQLQALVPPAWSTDWNLFKAEFILRFEDRQERRRAAHNLMNNKVVQISTARKFVDHVRDTCLKAGWTTEEQWMEAARNGLKEEVAAALDGRVLNTWATFIEAVIETDEAQQRRREQKKLTTPKKSATSTTNTNNNKGPREDLSKFKLSDEERKEHNAKNLCFKCHKAGHTLKDCKGQRTIYAEFKKTQVANVEVTEEKEDFVEGA